VTRNLIIALLAGAAGYAAFFYTFPRVDPLAPWPYQLDRQRAIALAQASARRLGVDTTGWRSGVFTENDLKLQYWQRRNARDGIDFFPSPVTTVVLFRDPQTRREVRVNLAQCTMVSGFTYRDRSLEESGAQDWAEMAFLEVAGPFASQFNKLPPGPAIPDWTSGRPPSGKDWSDFLKPPRETPWEHVSGSRITRIAVRNESKRERSVQLTNRWSDDFQRLYRDQEKGVQFAEVLVAVPAIVVTIAAIALFLQGALRRAIAWKRTLIFIGFLAVSIVIRHYTGFSAQAAASSAWASWTLLLGSLAVLIPVGAMLAAGETSARVYERDRWESFYLALRGRFDARAVGDSFTAGILFAGLLAAVPYVTLAIPWLSDAELRPAGLDILGSPAPALHVLLPAPEPVLMGFFFFFTPMLGRLITSSRWRGLLWWIIGTGLMLGSKPASLGLPTAFVAAVALWATLQWTYKHHGLLAALAASAFAGVAKVAGALLATGSAELHASGWRVLAGTAVVLGIALYVRVRGHDLQVDDVAVPSDALLTERERLKSAFTEAHVAQQRMLPVQAPDIEGFSLAAICQPAKEVGGDLYDYFRLADGRYGVCVADVSGKGMAAALYMTLTKGALTAAAQATGDLADLARRLNTHVYAAARRKVFVTASLVAIDPATLTIEHVRAGHNPVALRRANGEIRFLQPAGIGLGIGPTRLFARGLETESLSLEPGDALIFYSDGLTEAMNPRLEQYGEERLRRVLTMANGLDPEALRQRILDDVAAFTGTEPSHDDLTLLVVSCMRGN
jgi:serine phosphatase RsbU (regulator of sigma subunit)